VTVQFRAALAAGLAFAVLASPIAASSSTFVIGNGPANLCSILALAGKADNAALSVCNDALDHEMLSRDDLAKTFVNRGVVQMRRDNLAGAAHDFNRAEEIMPKLPEIYINQSVALIKSGKYAEAVTMADRGIALSPSEPEKAYFNRGVAREATGDVRGAYLDFTKATTLKPNWEAPKKELTRFQVQRPG
jgi:tetratricopeptide (TPR) repeat protein